jgi:FkbM family methyltransferase
MWYIAKIYALIYVIIKKIFNINIPGLGFILRRCKKERVFKYKNIKILFYPKAASNYGLHIINKPQEYETENILDFIFTNLELNNHNQIKFINVGSNIGIFLLLSLKYKDVVAIGFEPSKICCDSILKSMNLNDFTKFSIFNCAVGSINEKILFNESNNTQEISLHDNHNDGISINQISLDSIEQELFSDGDKVVMLIDVEGYELKVLKGARSIINNYNPLIIFEYNALSKKYFSLESIKNILPSHYKIYRLNSLGLLDSDTNNAWNCLAFPNHESFKFISKRIIK